MEASGFRRAIQQGGTRAASDQVDRVGGQPCNAPDLTESCNAWHHHVPTGRHSCALYFQAKLLEAFTNAPTSLDGEKHPSMEVSKAAIEQLPDFSHLLPPDYRKNYAAWRAGQPHGAKGELFDAVEQMAAMQDSMLNNTADDFTEISVFRSGYANWRRGGVSGAKRSMNTLRNELAW